MPAIHKVLFYEVTRKDNVARGRAPGRAARQERGAMMSAGAIER